MPDTSKKSILVVALFFTSGATTLVYEVLWLKELGLLFGNTSYATATTLAAFFLGLAVGGYVFGQRIAQIQNPLRVYGWLEIAVAATGIAYLLLLTAYHEVYPILFSKFYSLPAVFILLKFLLGVSLLFPTAFLMGGTLPVISQYLVQNMQELGSRVSMLYAVNTAGAALGAYAAGFQLPIVLGYRNTFFVNLCITVAVGVTAVICSSRYKASQSKTGTQATPFKDSGIPVSLNFLVFLSGFITLALQVLWTRMFSQVLQNSVYTFSAILVTFLLLLAIGASIANRIIRSNFNAVSGLTLLMSASGLSILASIYLFDWWTGGLGFYGDAALTWNAYVADAFLLVMGVLFFPLCFLGAVFPLLIKIAQPCDALAGRLVGRLVAINTLGAVFGSICAGFIMLDVFGLWPSLYLVAGIYLAAAILLCLGHHGLQKPVLLVTTIIAATVACFFNAQRIPVVRIDASIDEELVEVREGSAGTVAVVRRKDDLKIKVNNYYTLGGSGLEARILERIQTHLPLSLHPGPRSVYFIGLGTGITAGASLEFPIERLVVTEIVPDVISMTRKYFGAYTQQLFSDRRAMVVAEDGRNYLAGNTQRFDVIVADLFVPWKAGAGSLYTRQHFDLVRARLNTDGLFMLWLPTHQMTKDEFAIIANTMLQTFPSVTAWRGEFFNNMSLIGLMGKTTLEPLSASLGDHMLPTADPRFSKLPLLTRYLGNMSAMTARFAPFGHNSDEYPIIEYRTPISERRVNARKAFYLEGTELLRLLNEFNHLSPPETDTQLANLNPSDKLLPRAGHSLHRFVVLASRGDEQAANEALSEFNAVVAAP